MGLDAARDSARAGGSGPGRYTDPRPRTPPRATDRTPAPRRPMPAHAPPSNVAVVHEWLVDCMGSESVLEQISRSGRYQRVCVFSRRCVSAVSGNSTYRRDTSASRLEAVPKAINATHQFGQ